MYIVVLSQVDGDLSLPVELEASKSAADDGFYVPPTHGQPPTYYWVSNSRLVVDHVLAGAFDSAERLLRDQVGVVNMKPFRDLFISTYSRYVQVFVQNMRHCI